MKHNTLLILTTLITLSLASCSSPATETGDQQSPETETVPESTPEEQEPITKGAQTLPDSSLNSIPEVSFAAEVDPVLSEQGAAIFAEKCSMCHKPDQRFIGPAPKGILEKRSVDWIMKVIMYPDLMRQTDTTVQKLIEEFDGAVMPNQQITFEEARSILEYYRTL